MIKHCIQCGPELIRIQSTSSSSETQITKWKKKKRKVCKEKVSYHCGTKARGHYRFEICFCQPSLSRPKTSFALFSEVMLAQAAMTDTVKQLFTARPFKDEPLNPRLAPRFRCFLPQRGSRRRTGAGGHGSPPSQLFLRFAEEALHASRFKAFTLQTVSGRDLAPSSVTLRRFCRC